MRKSYQPLPRNQGKLCTKNSRELAVCLSVCLSVRHCIVESSNLDSLAHRASERPMWCRGDWNRPYSSLKRFWRLPFSLIGMGKRGESRG